MLAPQTSLAEQSWFTQKLTRPNSESNHDREFERLLGEAASLGPCSFREFRCSFDNSLSFVHFQEDEKTMAIKTTARQSSKPSAPVRKTKKSKVVPTVVVVLTGSTASSRKRSANALATSLQKELFTVDVSVLLSRYVEETATNLGYLFDKAETAGAILFFDEVDALFGSRTEVEDKFTDRYVNMAVDCLLQQIESYEGMIMFASNLPRSIELAMSGLAQVIVLVEAAGSGKKRKR